jgi:hypothetical protein
MLLEDAGSRAGGQRTLQLGEQRDRCELSPVMNGVLSWSDSLPPFSIRVIRVTRAAGSRADGSRAHARRAARLRQCSGMLPEKADLP